MPIGLNRSGDFRNGNPINTTTHNFGNPVTLPHDFGNDVTTPVSFGNVVDWQPSSDHFGNDVLLAPTISPDGGVIVSGQFITLDASGQDIYYTLDGSIPTFPPTGTTTAYTDPISSVVSNCVLSCITELNGKVSNVATASFVIAPVVVLSATPNHGPSDGDTVVDIVGSGFDVNNGVFDVLFNGVSAANFNVLDTEHIQATTDVGTPGTGDILVANDFVQGSLHNGWTYD